jgi:tRNA(adenine34) deaminase
MQWNFDKKRFMEEALKEAQKAFLKGEVPVGCVIVKDSQIVAKAHNRVEELSDPTAHAEILALREAASKLGVKELRNCEMFVTLEPCPMCAGAIALSGLKKLYFGAFNEKHGGVVGKFFILQEYSIPWERIDCRDCSKILQDFFRDLRKGTPEKDL